MSSILSFLNIANENNRRIAYTTHQSTNQIDNKANTVFICVPSLGDVKEECKLSLHILHQNNRLIHHLQIDSLSHDLLLKVTKS